MSRVRALEKLAEAQAGLDDAREELEGDEQALGQAREREVGLLCCSRFHCWILTHC